MAVAGSVFMAGALMLGGADARAACPEQPITLIVPWGAGGGTAQVARALAASMEAT
ncbi:MAG: tripartite tricarboxylate transporter substrate binding protein, partial [Proteobacteria bacterium]